MKASLVALVDVDVDVDVVFVFMSPRLATRVLGSLESDDVGALS